MRIPPRVPTGNEKHSIPPTGIYAVPHKRRSIVNPNGGKQREIQEKESPGIFNPKEDPSWR